jgi:DNA polymerase
VPGVASGIASFLRERLVADKKKIARQWVETDEAFGAKEVPVARAKRGAKKVAAAVKSAPAPVAAPVRAIPPLVSKPVVKQEPKFAISDAPIAPARAVKNAPAAAIPGIPAGDIADLPAINRQQKLAAMEKLLAETTAALAAYIDDVATRVVFGEGDVDAPVLFIGEGPGIEEDRTGRPFVGRAGQLLDKQIAAMKFERSQVYIANVVKLRAASPSEEWGGKLKDRPPTPEEVARNIVYLHKQIEIIRPKVIVTLGAPSFKHITGSSEGITKARGTWKSYRGIPVMPTLHPAYVLRNYTEETRRNVWEDLKKVLGKLK